MIYSYYDNSGRPYSVGESGGLAYLNSVAYTAAGGIDNLQLGNTLAEQTCEQKGTERAPG